MPMIPDSDIDNIKRTTDLAALVRSRGVQLQGGAGGNLVGRCPFHDDARPSFVVTPAKGLFRCMSPACGATGNAIQFIMRKDGLSFRHAVELLRAPSAAAFTATSKTVRALPPPVTLDADGKTLLRQVVGYYHERLTDDAAGRAARAYLQKRGLGSDEAIRAHKIGFADRTLGLRLPFKNRRDGADIRSRLAQLGVYRESTGHEHFNGCVVMPILDDAGEVAGIYGRKIVESQRTGIHHLYLPGPHRGWWNRDALKSGGRREVILCEALLDALTFWENGFPNATAAYGVEGFTQEMEDAFAAARLDRVFIAFDRDEAGETGARKVAARLMARGIECRRVLFPHGQDANEYARKTTPAGKALAVLLNAAAFIGRGSPDRGAAPNPGRVADPAPGDAPALRAAASSLGEVDPKPEVSADASHAPRARAFSLAAKAACVADAPAQTPPPGEAAKEEKSNVPSATPAMLTQRGEHWFFDADGREYRVGGLEKTLGTDALKIALRLKVADRFHLDTLDLIKDAERRRFVERAAEETGLHVDLLKRDIARLLLATEQTQAELARPAEKIARAVTLSEAERDEALAFLRAPGLVARLREAFRRGGIIGEENNTLVAYLAGVSRLLERPLAIIVQSGSAAGKTTLMDAVLAFFPEEERVKYSAMTGQSLYYLGETNLKHKILAIVEEAGAEKAAYALKLLQSEGELTIASTGKDPHTGRMETQEYHVEGPVMIMLTTTAIDLDEELQNRCLTLAVDESPEQTARIHALQRERRTLAGIVAKTGRAELLRVLKNAQRLLAPVEVLNPFAPQLTFPATRTRNRRDHEKYLTLIDAIALLHQHQRARGHHEAAGAGGRLVEYITVTLDDIALANELAPEVLGRSLDELPPQTRRLLEHIRGMVTDPAPADAGASGGAASLPPRPFTFTRRELHAHCGWSFTQLRVHLDRLVEHECIGIRAGRMGSQFVYELLVDADAPDASARVPLIDIAQLRKMHDYDETSRVDDGPPPRGASALDTNALPATSRPRANAHLDGHGKNGAAVMERRS